MNNTLIFDIGKTNKKALVFDKDFQVIDEQQTVFDEIGDIDGDPTDDVLKIEKWMLKILRGYKKANISTINFATYGATIAHLDTKGKLLATPFNYLKKIDPSIKQSFLEENGGTSAFCTATASPDLDVLLNSGFQLYWLKKTRPDFFKKIKTTLHLPQYFSYVLTGQVASEYTSIGCHTMLWDFSNKKYHNWLEKECLLSLFPTISPIYTTFQGFKTLEKFNIGIGIHDSSAALLPYLAKEKQPFLLLSTGTWSICLNPFNTEPLSADEFTQDCLFYMRPDGQSVKAARLFLGKIHDEALEKILNQHNKQVGDVRNLSFDEDIYNKILRGRLEEDNNRNLLLDYLELMHKLVESQVTKIQLAAGNTYFNKIIVDGGFAKNSIYLAMLRRAFPDKLIAPSDMPQGTALGAALAVTNHWR